jgi:mannosylfructose-phosphate synthase
MPRDLNILQITNHGMHDWQVTPGLPDTGGQNVYVNQLTDALVHLGHRVTITNRGGYPHPLTGEPRTGTSTRHDGRARLAYLTDDTPAFVRKEDMAEQLPALTAALAELMHESSFDLVLSHYWDAGALGMLANARLATPPPHLWVPHSLGMLKSRNVEPRARAALRIDERIEHERRIIAGVDGVVSTSGAIGASLEAEYGHAARYFVPPGVDADVFRPRADAECSEGWNLVAGLLDRSVEEVRGRPLIMEVSRTDRTKRKDVLIRAFATVREHVADALLAVSIDPVNRPLHDELQKLIDDLGVRGEVAVLGSVWDQLPCLYAISDVFCTPSIMEGFGMTSQEAAACATPVVASENVPFAVEYLLGPNPVRTTTPTGVDVLVGEGATVVPIDSVEGFAASLVNVLTDADLRHRQGHAANAITVPAFSWDGLARRLLDDLMAAEVIPGG